MLYIHVPFCKTRCIYCDFYSTTYLSLRDKYVEALCHEICERANYLPTSRLVSVYLGGGTPSQLDAGSLKKIFDSVQCHFTITPDVEVTIEANPDDITETFADTLRQLPVNRISLGVQTFNDQQLKFLNRRHNAHQVENAVSLLHHKGFDNISIDLIYGLPRQSLEDWKLDLDKAFLLPVTHLSAYALIYETGTQLWKLKEKGIVQEADEELSLQMFTCLMDKASNEGFEHYEISNFSRPGCHSRHNSGYWKDVPYLGVGPGAHSFNGTSRRWNTACLKEYIASEGKTDATGLFEEELLTEDMLHNEFVMKRLRTAEGILLDDFSRRFGGAALQTLLRNAAPYINKGELILCDNHKKIRLSRSGIFISDGIMSDLFR